MLAGILPQYGLNYHEHYSRTYEGVKLGWAFYLAAVCSGLSIICSTTIYITRDTGYRFTVTKKKKIVSKTPAKGVGIDFKGTQKNWLMKKNVPIPLDQKIDNTPAVQEIEVKRGKVHSIVAPTMVLLAMKRLKSGKERASLARETKDPVIIADRSPTPPSDNDKYKGIFTVQVDNTQDDTPTPPRPPPPAYDTFPDYAIQRRTSTSSSSSSSSESSSDSNVSVQLDLVVTKKGGESVPQTAARPSLRKHSSQMESSLRANVRPAVARRHTGMTENKAMESPTVPVSQPQPDPPQNMDLYAIPDEPGSQHFHSYEDVVVGDSHLAPEPVQPLKPAVQRQFY